MRNCAINKIKKENTKKDNPPIKFGPSLPNNYEFINTCVFYFNIEGSFNDPSNIYLVAFVNDNTGKRNTFLILKNNQWFVYFSMCVCVCVCVCVFL